MVSYDLRSSSNLSFLMIFIFFQTLAFMYSIWDCHVPLPDSSKPRCDQRQVILKHLLCRVKGGGYASCV